MEKLLVLLCLLHVCYGVIYNLNETEYYRMPPKYAGDSFEKCHWDPDAVYCFGEFVLVSDTPSPLLDLIREYSDHNTTHFNHTKIRRGLCLTQSCKKFNLTSVDIGSVLEACLNESIYDQYQLKTRITEMYSCNQPSKDMQLDTLDVVIGIICALIVLVNLIGSVCEPIFREKKDCVSRFLRCFSIRNNWKKLTAPVAESQDPRVKRLKSVHGIRTISIVLVIMGHSILACVAYIDNPEYLEQMYHIEAMQVLFSGMLIMQTFLVMSGFLLIYNTLLQAEKQKISWTTLPKLIVMKWLRLTPSYAVVLALTVTWFRYLTNGPLWQELIAKEAMECRENWWMHLLYINNYNDYSQCMQQTWYLAVDTQLYCFGVIVYMICTTPCSRKILLPIIFVIGCIIPGLITYFKNLDGSLIASPEAIHSIFMNEPTFNNTYSRGHTNLPGNIIGISVGYLVYHWQKKGIDIKRLRKYRYFVPLLVPTAVALIYACSLFYADRPRPSIYVRAASACVIKPAFSFIFALILISFIFKIDDLCRRILEWRGWAVPSRLSYCAYLLHVSFIRSYVAYQTAESHTNVVLISQVFIGFALASFLTAIPLFLIVEAPVGNLIREYTAKLKKPTEKVDEEIQNGIKEENGKQNLNDAEKTQIKEENGKQNLNDAEKTQIEKNVSLQNLRETVSVDGQTRF